MFRDEKLVNKTAHFSNETRLLASSWRSGNRGGYAGADDGVVLALSKLLYGTGAIKTGACNGFESYSSIGGQDQRKIHRRSEKRSQTKNYFSPSAKIDTATFNSRIEDAFALDETSNRGRNWV